MDEDTNSMNSELVICPDCNCQVSPHRLEDHRLHRCLKHKVKLNRVRRPKLDFIQLRRIAKRFSEALQQCAWNLNHVGFLLGC